MNRAEKGAWAEARRGVMTARIAELAPSLEWIGSVCTGSMLLAEAGLVKGTSGPRTLTNRSEDDRDGSLQRATRRRPRVGQWLMSASSG
ncbi:hypothetical protein OHA10_08890 [Kribbella sp. NBC_00662]|uniref:hypothetical protein n=1 Tax=Kribbella sp. NBC_00662 TaxID=2975969 RepID=UPI0032535269